MNYVFQAGVWSVSVATYLPETNAGYRLDSIDLGILSDVNIQAYLSFSRYRFSTSRCRIT